VSASDLRLSARALGLTAALVASAQALAQNPPVITDADIERVRREMPTVTDQDIDAARRKYGMPSDAELRSAPVPTRPTSRRCPSPSAAPRSTSKRWHGAMHRKPMQ
jgi:conjugal transfer pilus assembly protein TrbC